MDPIYETNWRHRRCREKESRLEEEIASLKAQLAELKALRQHNLEAVISEADELHANNDRLRAEKAKDAALTRYDGDVPHVNRALDTAYQRGYAQGSDDECRAGSARLELLLREVVAKDKLIRDLVDMLKALTYGLPDLLEKIGYTDEEHLCERAEEVLARAKEVGDA